jgi:hypothetical protein
MEDLVEFIDRMTKELAESLGLKLIEPEKEKKKKGAVTGTITFLKGESAIKAASFYKKSEMISVKKESGECTK